MKLKKLTVCALAFTLAAALVGCGSGPVGSGQADSGSTAPQSGAVAGAAAASWFGRVSAVAGNELTLELAKQPEPEAPDSNIPTPDDEGTVPAMEMVPATAAGEAEGGGAAQRTELEYTGETKDFVLPGGLVIKDGAGNEKQLSDVKKSSILAVFTDEGGQVVDLILYE